MNNFLNTTNTRLRIRGAGKIADMRLKGSLKGIGNR
jgi:hypothetical protein